MRHTPTLVIMLAMCSTPAFAQTSAEPPVTHHQILATNPFGLLFNWFNAEYERQITSSMTLGASVSHIPRLDHSNAALLVRWYPQREALDGLYLGARAGAYAFETYEYEPYPTAQTRPVDPALRASTPYPIFEKRTTVVPGAGIEIGYNWRLGAKRRVSIGLGFGLTRLLRDVDSDDFLQVLPNPRVVNIGIAF